MDRRSSIVDRRPRLIPAKPTPFDVEESDVLSASNRGEKGWCSSGSTWAEERIIRFCAEKRLSRTE
jgi:hypothetical protein